MKLLELLKKREQELREKSKHQMMQQKSAPWAMN